MRIHWYACFMITFVFSWLPDTAFSQEVSDAGKSGLPIVVHYLSFRPAAWEEKTIVEEVLIIVDKRKFSTKTNFSDLT